MSPLFRNGFGRRHSPIIHRLGSAVPISITRPNSVHSGAQVGARLAGGVRSARPTMAHERDAGPTSDVPRSMVGVLSIHGLAAGLQLESQLLGMDAAPRMPSDPAFATQDAHAPEFPSVGRDPATGWPACCLPPSVEACGGSRWRASTTPATVLMTGVAALAWMNAFANTRRRWLTGVPG